MAEVACAPSIQACYTRIGALDAAGVPAVGTKNVYVTDKLVKFDVKERVVTGDDFQVKNACGLVVASYRAPDVLAGYDVTLEVSDLDPEMFAILVGGSLYTSAGTTIGWQSPPLKTTPTGYNGVSLEFWTKRIVGDEQDGTYPWWWWAWPRVRLVPSARVFDNNPMQQQFVGFADENPNWEDGPVDAWTLDSTKVFQVQAATGGTLPNVACGAQNLPAT